MNVDGRPLLSRNTVAAGRSLLMLSFGIILVRKLDVDYEVVTVTGVALKEGQINSGIIWITGLLVFHA